MSNPYDAIENTSTPTSSTSTTTSRTTSTTTSGYGSSSTTPRARVREEEAVEQDVFEGICAEAEHCIGQHLTPYIRQEIAGWLSMVDANVILYALHQTAAAPRPAWRYTHAILIRCRTQGITGKQAAIEDQLLYTGLYGSHTKSPDRVMGSSKIEPDFGLPY